MGRIDSNLFISARTHARVNRRIASIALGAAMALAPVLAVSTGSATAAVITHKNATAHLSGAPITFVVNTTSDTNDVVPGNSKCVDFLGKCSLRAAIEEANSLSRPVIIKLAHATYPTTLGALTPTSSFGITIVGVSATETKIDASGTSDRVFTINTTDTSAIISNLTITGGVAPNSGPYGGEGGNILVGFASDSLTLNSVVVSHGSSSSHGGGIFNDGAMWINQSAISYNTVTNSSGNAEGGGIYEGGDSMNLVNSTVSHNQAIGLAAQEGAGGGVYANRGIEILGGSFIDNSALTSNSDAKGGGLYSGQQASVTGTSFTGNIAGPGVSSGNVAAYGGAIFSCYGASLMSHVTVSTNYATAEGTGQAFGGGIDINCGAATLVSPKLTHNTARAIGSGNAYGGGLSVGDLSSSHNSANVVITNAEISSNTAASLTAIGNGGGISIYAQNSGGGGAVISNSTINSNHANSAAGSSGSGNGGGGIYDRSCGGGSIITSTTMSFNVAQNAQGGALYNDSCGDTLIGDRIISNQATGSVGTDASSSEGVGGGLSLYDTSRVINTIVANNTATQMGGGVYSDDIQFLFGNTIRANRANRGAGLFIDYPGTFRSDAFVDNVGTGAASQGGGIYFNDRATLVNSTIAGNSASDGAGIYTTGDAGVLKATLIAGNHLLNSVTENNCSLDSSGDFGSAGGNRIGDSSCTVHAVQDRQGKADVGYNVISPSGRIFNFNTTSYGSPLGKANGTNGHFVALANNPDGQGYWTVTSRGHVYSFGSSLNYGGAAGQSIVAITAAPDGAGYWLLGSNGVVHAFGSAAKFGNAPGASVAMAATPDGQGYWIVGTNGLVSHFGSATALGSAKGKHVVAIASAPDGQGYWLALSNGAVMNFGTAGAHGSSTGKSVVGIASAPDGQGFYLLGSNGALYLHGNEQLKGSPLKTFHFSGPVSSISSM